MLPTLRPFFSSFSSSSIFNDALFELWGRFKGFSLHEQQGIWKLFALHRSLFPVDSLYFTTLGSETLINKLRQHFSSSVPAELRWSICTGVSVNEAWTKCFKHSVDVLASVRDAAHLLFSEQSHVGCGSSSHQSCCSCESDLQERDRNTSRSS